MQCNAMQLYAMPCNAVQCGAVRFGSVRRGAVRCGAVTCRARQCNAMQYNTLQCNPIQHRLFPTKDEIALQQQFVLTIGMIGKGLDRNIILSWSIPNIDYYPLSMCVFQFRFASTIMPTQLDDCTPVAFLVCPHLFRSGSAERLRNNIKFVLDTCDDILFTENHTKSLRSS